MRYIIACVMLALTLLFTSCTNAERGDRLAYQSSKLYVEATFTLDGEVMPVTLTLEAPEYDDDGRMLARDATLTLGENSIISGVKFEIVGGEVYVSSGTLKIPIADAAVVSGVSDIISLFCISGEYYHSSENTKIGGVKCERAVYVNGDNKVEVTLDTTCMLPTDIVAEISGRTIAADISYIKAE